MKSTSMLKKFAMYNKKPATERSSPLSNLMNKMPDINAVALVTIVQTIIVNELS